MMKTVTCEQNEEWLFLEIQLNAFNLNLCQNLFLDKVLDQNL